jgi:hypothetical protein
MYQTVQVSSCVSAQGDLIERLPNGDALVSDGVKVYRGRPITPFNGPEDLRPPLSIVGRPDEA